MDNVVIAYRLPVARQAAITAVCEERLRQEKLHSGHTLNLPCVDDHEKLTALIEEIGEVAREIAYDTADDKIALKSELTQVAALAIAWLEGLQ